MTIEERIAAAKRNVRPINSTTGASIESRIAKAKGESTQATTPTLTPKAVVPTTKPTRTKDDIMTEIKALSSKINSTQFEPNPNDVTRIQALEEEYAAAPKTPIGITAKNVGSAFAEGGFNQVMGGLYGAIGSIDERTAELQRQANVLPSSVQGLVKPYEIKPYNSKASDASIDFKQAAEQNYLKNTKNASQLGKKVIGLSQSAGNMLASVGIAPLSVAGSGSAGLSLLPKSAGLTTMGVSAGGSAAMDAKQAGATPSQALTYGALVGATEVATEKLFGGNPLFDNGAGLINKIVGKVTTNPKLLSFLSSAPVETLNEGTEEMLATILQPVYQRLTYDPNADLATIDQIIESGIDGIILSSVMQGGNATGNATSKAVQGVKPTTKPALVPKPIATPTRQAQIQPKPIQPITDMAQKVVPQNATESVTQDVVPTQHNAVAKTQDVVLPQGMGAASTGFDKIGTLVEQNGAIPAGMNPATDRLVELPKKDAEGGAIPYAYRSVAESKAVPKERVQEIEDYIIDGKASLPTTTNASAVAKVNSKIESDGYQAVLDNWVRDVADGRTGDEIIATGAILIQNAAKNATGNQFIDIVQDYAKVTRNTAQALQAAQIIKKLTPEGKMMLVQREVAKLNEQEVEKKKRKTKAKDATLPDVEGITIDPALVSEYLNETDSKKQDAILDRIYQNVADQVKSTGMDKWTALRYLNMLGNLKTQIKNLSSNTVMKLVRAEKDKIGALLETAVDKINKASGGKGIERTKSFIVGKEFRKAGLADAKNVADALKGEGKYNSVGALENSKIQDKRTIFKNNGTWGTKANSPAIAKGFRATTDLIWKGLEGYRKATNWAMETGDIIFSHTTYASAYGGYLRANRVTAQQIKNGEVSAELVEKARAYAIGESLKAVFRDANQVSDFVQGLKVKNPKGFFGKSVNVIGEGILPFRRTPANVLVRGYEYGPLEFVNATVAAVKVATGNKDIAVSKVIDKFASAITGTGLLALGMYLKSLGMLRGGADDDERQAKFDDLLGTQPYSLELPDGTSITLDALSPSTISMFMGAELMDILQGEGLTLEDGINIIGQFNEPTMEMTMLKGLNDALEAGSYEDNKLSAFVMASLTGYITQGLSTTVGGQIERTFEPERMTTYTDKNSLVPTDLQYTLGKVSSKTPGLDYQQIPYINAWGETEKTGTTLERAAQNFLLPAYVSKVNPSDMEKELQRLYDKTGESVFPVRPQKTVKANNTDYDLTADEYVAFAKTKGKTAYSILTDVTKSREYKALPDDVKADVVQDVYDYAQGKAVNEFLKSRKEPLKENSLVTELSGAEKLKITPTQFLTTKYKFTNTPAEVDRRTLLKTPNLTPKQKTYLDTTLISKRKNLVDYTSKETFEKTIGK